MPSPPPENGADHQRGGDMPIEEKDYNMMSEHVIIQERTPLEPCTSLSH